MTADANIVLIGFMGSGKSTVGICLAERLGFGFADTDAEVLKTAGIPISDIFARYGEKEFRRLEKQAALYCAGLKRHVIATGGGVFLDEAAAALKTSGLTIYLQCPPDVVYERLAGDSTRPLLNGSDSDKLRLVSELMAKREPLYQRYADFTVSTHDKPIGGVVRAIVGIVYGE